MAREERPPYFMYFPGNYRWSAAMLGMLSTAGWGGADINEVDKIGRLLKGAKVGDDEAWFDACLEGRATRCAPTRSAFEASGHRTRPRRSTCAHASTTRWASASARPRTRRPSRRTAFRSNAFIASPR